MLESEDRPLTSQEAIACIIESLDDVQDSLATIADFFATLDVALQSFPDTDRVMPAGFVRAYKKAARELEDQAKAEEAAGSG